MAIISPVEAKSLKGRLLHLVIIIALSVGGLTMVYPFAIMLSGSVRSELDEVDLNLIPRFWHDEETVYAKFLETKYNQDVSRLNRSHLANNFDFASVQAPTQADEATAEALEAWIEEGLPRHWQALGGVMGIKTVPENLRDLRFRLHDRFNGDLQALSRNLGVPVSSWGTIMFGPPDWTSRRYDYADDALTEQYFALTEERPIAERQLVSLTGAFLEKMIYPIDGQNSVLGYNRRHPGYQIERYRDFRLPRTLPGEDQPTLRAEWIEFVLQELNPSFIVVKNGQDDAYRQMLDEAYKGDIGELNRAWGTSYDDFGQIPLPSGEWLSGQQRQDYLTFVRQIGPEQVMLVGPEYAWAEHVATLSEGDDVAAGLDRSWLPLAQLEWKYVRENVGDLRWTYTVRNYVNVWDELVTQGNALMNTIIYVILSITLALLINPLAAYAMSRYQLPGAYKILLVLMATMAFPPMVTMIPQFIVLRKLGLFNTFAALVLPLIVNGYMIFLLKGFFDSLPRELYEAARIDGSGEIRMFFGITMALSKPILAVLALSTFTSSYMAFLYPLLVAPDPDMWLISVWLYQFQGRSSTAGVFASVVIASLPTLVVFLFVQRTIMRGIVVPTEK